MNEEKLNMKFINYGKKHPFKSCVFHTNLNRILNLPYYLKQIVSVYIDEAENNPEVDHINSLYVEPQGKHGHAIFYSHNPIKVTNTDNNYTDGKQS